MSLAVLPLRCRATCSPLRSLLCQFFGRVYSLVLRPASIYTFPNCLQAVEVTSPNATYELVVRTEMKKGTTIPKGRYSLPREPKAKSKDKILVFAEGRIAEEAKKAGADIVGGPELVDGIINGRHQATMFLCTPALIRAITPKLGRVLGPRGLMPSERRGTVTEDIAAYIRRLKGTSEWKGDKLHYPIEDVVRNVRYFLGVVKRATGNVRDPDADSDKKGSGSTKPGEIIGTWGLQHAHNFAANAIKRVILSSRQGPGIQISDV
ncbi:hypothetical protein NLI96_g3757 [Meripilus lineatus]|uniref:Ribosomal protein n=1 Tax=Meripilus lineatus TaxID=2056292 RepID=A0AAD5VBL1_9APHY|nr:hypothetical protein NLI96_g3757 [Physisporinus lineatus]